MKKIVIKLCALLLLLVFVFSFVACESESAEPMLISDPILENASYLLGDTMGDYTLTDVNGVTYSFSEILSEKKALILNFWFINCGPCRMEFPYLEEAYNTYKEDIEVLAINCVGDSSKDIKAFAQEFGLTFPVIEGDYAWEKAMHIQGYPTTVVIDRFGKITMKHTGYVDSTETFENIFEFFTSDHYVATEVKDLNDI